MCIAGGRGYQGRAGPQWHDSNVTNEGPEPFTLEEFHGSQRAKLEGFGAGMPGTEQGR